MINKDELIFAVDENNNPIAPVTRQKAHAEGIWHRVAHIWVLNSKQEILCHKRSMRKDTSPGKWDVYFGGHILAGADAAESALKELEEEIGVRATPAQIKFIETSISPNDKDCIINNEFLYVYIYHTDLDEKSIKFGQEEIDEVKWINMKTVLEELSHDKNKKWCQPPYVAGFLTKLINS